METPSFVTYNVGMTSAMEQVFLQAYDDYADAIFRHLALRLGDREQGRDLMQETFLKAWEYVSKGKKVDNIRAFLYRVANNLLIDLCRRKKIRKEESLEDLHEQKGFDPPAEEDNSAEVRIDSEPIMKLLHAMEEPLRTVIVLRYIDGLPPSEIAEILKVSPNVVSVRIHRGMEKLRSLIPTS